MLEQIDPIPVPQVPQDDGWEIKDDAQADWALRRIAEAKQDLEKWRSFYKDRIAKAENEYDFLRETMRRKLEAYFAKVPHRETATQQKYVLPSGDLILKKPKRVYDHDDAALLKWLEERGYTDCIKTAVRWEKAKARLTDHDTGIVYDKETGEICDAVKVIETDAEFDVAIKE